MLAPKLAFLNKNISCILLKSFITLHHYEIICGLFFFLQEIVIYDSPDNRVFFLFMLTRLLKAEKWIPLHELTEQRRHNLPVITGAMFLFHIPPTFHWWRVTVGRRRCECWSKCSMSPLMAMLSRPNMRFCTPAGTAKEKNQTKQSRLTAKRRTWIH